MQIRTLSVSVKLKIAEIEAMAAPFASVFHPYPLPAIMVSPIVDKSRLAYYDTSSDAIIFQEDFIMNTGRYEERNVLLHELSHALQYRRDGFTDHGPGFRAYNEMLGTDPAFSKADVHEHLRKEEGYARKIEKLLALSSSPYEEESRSAIMMAERLMAEHGLRYAFENRDEDKLYYVILAEKARFMQSEKAMYGLVRQLTGVFLVFEYKADDNRRQAVLYGTLEQIETAVYLWTYLTDELERSLRKARREKNGSISNESFRMGLILGLRERISKEDAEAERALVLSSDKSQRVFQRISGQHITMKRNRATLHSLSDYNRGMESSKSIRIPRKHGNTVTQKQITGR